MANQYVKKATQMVGIAVAKAPRETLVDLYSKTLSVLASMPSSALYRQQTEQITNHRLDMVKAEENVNKLEKRINCGQIEEVIIQAKDELNLAENMAEWKPWEGVATPAPPGQWS